MASYNPPKKGVAYRMYVSLRSQADTKLFQVNPTLATGDAKVSKDGGALANLATLPSVIGSSAIVQIDLSSSEMTADNVAVLLSDASGAQWCDLMINLQTAALQFDELATAAALDAVDNFLDTEVAAILAAVDTEIAAIKAKTDNLPSDPADDSDIDAQLAAIAGYLDTEITAIKAKTDNLPSDPADDSDIDAQLAAIAAYLDTEIAAILAAVDTEVAAIKAKTDNLPAAPAAEGSAMTLAANAVNASALAADAVAEIQSGLSTLSAAQVNAEVVDALSVDTYAELTSVPSAVTSPLNMLRFLYLALRNKRITSATQDKIRNDTDSADVATAILDDNGTTFTRGKYT